MSHFTCFVIVPPNTPDIKKYTEDQLAPFNEYLEVDEYEASCWCVGGGIADPECPDCNGTGTYLTTYNPKSKWDWGEIGGRWDGYITQIDTDDRQLEALKNNTAAIETLLMLEQTNGELITPFAILTPNGEWHDCGEMGWFGAVSNEKEESEWELEVRLIYEKYKDHTAVCYDLHI